MIPSEVADLADLIWPGWRDVDDITFSEVLEAAWRIYNAGYRKVISEDGA